MKKFIASLIIVGGIWFGVSSFISLGPSVVETTPVVFKAIGFTAGAEALLDLTAQRNYVDAGKAVNTQPVSTGRLLVLKTLCVGATNAGAAIQSVVVKLRVNPTGAALINSPVVATVGVATYVATANVANANCIPFGEGLELSGANQLAITAVGSALAGFDAVLYGYERAL